MTAAEWSSGKYYALKMLVSMIAWFDNWREVWDCYRSGTTLPPLQLRHGFTLQHRPEDMALAQVAEVVRGQSYRRLVKESASGIIIDIGANIGVTALDWATRLPAVHVHAYEPHPATFALLAANVAANHLAHQIETHQEAVGHHSGTLRLRTGAASVLTTAYEAGATNGYLGAGELAVPMVSLNEVIARCAGREPIALLKIDAEGAEADILEGATSTTLGEVLQIVLEYHDDMVPGALERCRRLLTKTGFECVTHPDHSRAGLGLLYCQRIRDARNRALARSQ
jgi:FkbM family methyltransferase